MDTVMIDMNKEIELQLYYLDIGNKLKYFRERMLISKENAAGCLFSFKGEDNLQMLEKIESGKIDSLTNVERLCMYYNIPFSTVIRRSYNDTKR